MPLNIPVPRDGTKPIANPGGPRPWPSGRRLLMPLAMAAALVLVPSGAALACTTPTLPTPAPTCDHHVGCLPKPVPTHWPTPTRTHTAPPSTPAPTTPAPPETTATTPAPSAPTTAVGASGCEDTSTATDTCAVVSGTPSFTG